VAAGGSRACQQTRHGRATTTRMAQDTTVGHRNEGRLGDASACRAGHACDEQVQHLRTGCFFLWETPGLGGVAVHCGVGRRVSFLSQCCGNTQKIQVSPRSHTTPLVTRLCRDVPRPSRLRHNTDVTRHGLTARTHDLHHIGACMRVLVNDVFLQPPRTTIYSSTT
jgi:hypothetical protein